MEVMARRDNDLWFTECQTPNMRLSLRITAVLRSMQTRWQQLLVAESQEYGRFLALDGAIQITDRDEFAYHEMMAHIPLCAHPCPKRVLVVGGGDGGIVREVVKHDALEKVTLVDIDEEVTKASRDFFPAISSALDHPKVEVLHMDALVYVKEHPNEFDAVIVDSTDPVDFAAGLFGAAFYADAYKALKEGGILMAQTESPFAEPLIIPEAFAAMRRLFPHTALAWGAMPTYPTGMWTYLAGSKRYDPKNSLREVPEGTKYYTPEIHKAAFQLPPFVKAMTEK